MGLEIEEFKTKPAYSKAEVDKLEVDSIRKELNEMKVLLRQVIDQVKQMSEGNIYANQQSIQSLNQSITEELSSFRLDLIKLSDSFEIMSERLNEMFNYLANLNQVIENNNQMVLDSIKAENEVIEQPINQSLIQTHEKEKKLDRFLVEKKPEGMPDRLARVLQAFETVGSEWVTHEQLGAACEPALTKDGVRGYISELINNFNVQVEKKKVGRTVFVRILK